MGAAPLLTSERLSSALGVPPVSVTVGPLTTVAAPTTFLLSAGAMSPPWTRATRVKPLHPTPMLVYPVRSDADERTLIACAPGTQALSLVTQPLAPHRRVPQWE